jgi:Zn-dependent peptidase ImmA (M78 family)
MIKFYNPFQDIINAAKFISPKLKCIIQFDPKLANGDNYPHGETLFQKDKSIIISVSSKLSVENALEVLAHELAHAIVGYDDKHGYKWKRVFNKIHKEYIKIVKRKKKCL